MPDNQDERHDLDQIVRVRDGKLYHGFSAAEARVKIRQGKLPKPFPLTPGGRAKAWTKRQLLEHQRSVIEAFNAEERAREEREAAERETRRAERQTR
jgi:hypothetical protein